VVLVQNPWRRQGGQEQKLVPTPTPAEMAMESMVPAMEAIVPATVTPAGMAMAMETIAPTTVTLAEMTMAMETIVLAAITSAAAMKTVEVKTTVAVAALAVLLLVVCRKLSHLQYEPTAWLKFAWFVKCARYFSLQISASIHR
jgi:hypothetical protein